MRQKVLKVPMQGFGKMFLGEVFREDTIDIVFAEAWN